jgi:hypothetical protein
MKLVHLLLPIFGLLIYSGFALADLDPVCVNDLGSDGVSTEMAQQNCDSANEVDFRCVTTLASVGMDGSEAIENCRPGSGIDATCVAERANSNGEGVEQAMRDCEDGESGVSDF